MMISESEGVALVCYIKYGEICDAWANNWDAVNDPFAVLKEWHTIHFGIGSGWTGFLLWADQHCTDRVEIDWGSRAWKCKGAELIQLDRERSAEV